MRKLFVHSLRYYCYLLATIIILVAVLLQSARILAPQVGSVRPSIENFLSDVSGTSVSLGQINASWYGLRPHVLVSDAVFQKDDKNVFSVKKIDLSLDILHSLRNLQWTWRHVSFEDVYLNIQQDESGKFTIAGFSSSNKSSSGWRYHSPAELFNIVPQVEITQATAQITFANQKRIEVSVPSIKIENSQDFHRLQAFAKVDDVDAFSVVLERQHSHTVGFVKFTQLPLNNIIRSVSSVSDVEQQPSIELSDVSTVDMSLWLDFTDESFSFVGNLSSLYSGKHPIEDNKTIDLSISTDISGNYHFNESWSIGLRDFIVDQHQKIQQIQLSQTKKEMPRLSVDHLSIDSWAQWVEGKLFVSEESKKSNSLLQKFDARGDINNLTIDIDVDDKLQSIVSANVENVSTNPVKNIPGFKNVTGYVQHQLLDGFINLNAKDMHLFPQQMYEAPFVFDEVNAQIAWRLRPKQNSLVVNSGQISAESIFGQANGYFFLDLPWNQGTRPSDFNLYIGLQNSSAEYHQQFIPNKVPEALTNWLDGSINEGRISQAGFIYRGGFSKSSTTSRTIQLFVDVEQARLDYSSDWPELSQLQGSVSIDNTVVSAVIDSASIMDQSVSDWLVYWPDDGKGMLSIVGQNDITAQSGLRLIKESWLKSKVGNTFDHWSATGDINIGVDIEVPLLKQEQVQVSPKQDVSIQFLGNNLNLSDQRLDISSVKGELIFNSQGGLYAEKLDGVIFDKPLSLHITQTSQAENGSNQFLSIQGVGSVESTDLAAWSNNPSLLMLDGVIPYQVEVLSSISDRELPVTVTARSNLSGVNINLPQPFGKTKEEEKQFEIVIQKINEGLQYQIGLGEKIAANILFEDNGYSGFLSVNSAQKEAVSDKTFSIFASLGNVVVEQWLESFTRYQQLSAPFLDGDNIVHPLLSYDIDVQALTYRDTHVSNVQVEGKKQDHLWSSTINSQLVQGDVIIDDTFATPIQLDLSALHIPSNEATEDVPLDSDPWSDIDFSSIKPMNVSVKTVLYKNKPFTDLRFSMEYVGDKIMVDNLFANFSGLLLSGEEEAEGARLFWYKDVKNNNGSWRSIFNGRLKGGDIQSLFDEWGLPSVLKSENTDIIGNIAWLGSPAFFAVEKLSGYMSFNIDNGIFLQNKQQSQTDILRLFSLFNFNTWARRLRLDFSDVYKKGIVFDGMSAKISFDLGKMYFQEPLYVRSPSSEFTMAGVIDYLSEDIDAVLITTLPIRGNLAFAAGLAAGLPAAVGVYLVGKIFKPQVDKASSLTYSVKGKWDKPNIKFIKLFGNDLENNDDEPQPIKNGSADGVILNRDSG